MGADGWLGRLLAWSRQAFVRHPIALDVLAATVLTAGALWGVSTLRHDTTVPATVVAGIACTSAVGWRRLAPSLAALVALTAVVGYQISGQDTQGEFISLAIVLTCFTVGRAVTSRLQQVAVAAYALAAVTGIELDTGFSLPEVVLTWVPLAVMPIAAGVFLARRDALVRQLGDARARLQGEQGVARARAVAEERTRVARELHDVVAHCVSVMVIQAGAARLLMTADLAAARDAVRVVGASGREALADLRRVVGVRRHSDETFAAAPPGLAQLPELVARARAAGTCVQLHLDADTALSADLAVATFRIVQEALTNVRKHAPRADAKVVVSVGAEVVEISVEDSGPAGPANADGSGHGLVGMRERVALHGGELHAGATRCGGFAVHAQLPLVSQASPGTVEHTVSPARRSRRRLSAARLDALFSLAWLVPLEIEASTSPHRSGALALNAAVVAVMALCGVFRRRAPLAFVLSVGALAMILSGGVASPQRASVVGSYTLFVGAYSVAAYCDRRRAFAGLGVLLAGVTGMTVAHHAGAGVAFGGALMAGIVWIVGRVVRNQRMLIAELHAANARLAADRDQRARQALCEERIRISNDLHAIVAQLVTAMVVQAEAATDLLDADGARAAESIGAIEQTGRHALVQLRQVLGVLRNRLDPAPRQPQIEATLTEPRSELLLAVQS